MPDLTIGEIVQQIFNNNSLLDALKQKIWQVEIESVHREKFGIIKSPKNELKVRQWDYPAVFMQAVWSDGNLVYHVRGKEGPGLFEHPDVYIPGPWEEMVRKLHSLYAKQEKRG